MSKQAREPIDCCDNIMLDDSMQQPPVSALPSSIAKKVRFQLPDIHHDSQSDDEDSSMDCSDLEVPVEPSRKGPNKLRIELSVNTTPSRTSPQSTNQSINRPDNQYAALTEAEYYARYHLFALDPTDMLRAWLQHRSAANVDHQPMESCYH